jgi:hypothetical protein
VLEMTALTCSLLASFTTPLRIDTNAASMLWLLPLVVTIAVVYKATKVHQIRAKAFARETALLIGSIMVFIAVAALILYGVAWLVTEQLPATAGGSAF